jgi:hypothetical protein
MSFELESLITLGACLIWTLNLDGRAQLVILKSTCAMTVATTRIPASISTTVGPILMPGVSSSKNLMRPAPPDGIGPSPRFPFLFFAVFGIATTFSKQLCLQTMLCLLTLLMVQWLPVHRDTLGDQ